MSLSQFDSDNYHGELYNPEQYTADWKHIESLPGSLTGLLGLEWHIGDSPERCQDGSKMASVHGGYRIQDRRETIHYWLPVATIHFSQLQRIFTIETFVTALSQFNKVDGREDYRSDALRHLHDEYIVASLAANGFRHVHWIDLQERYYGKILEFSGQITWFERFFSRAF